MNLELGALTVKLDVLLVQIINIGILFRVFKKFVSGRLSSEIIERRILMKKLKSVDDEYKKIIQQAEQEKNSIIEEAKRQKQQMYQEGVLAGEQKMQQIVDKANKDADIVIENAKNNAQKIKEDLMKDWQNAVK
ncbi:MAG TPA: ATP synthase F0 subunit B, partial [Candidatus Absconditabacterales bacterium]|nr:ATP synthase F0 subunit B [Candidatus Absconditabacterales bacterium]